MNKRFQKAIHRRRILMSDKHVQSCSNLLLVKQLQIITMRCNFISIRMLQIRTWNHSNHSQGCGQTGTFTPCWQCILQQPFWKAIWQYLAKLRTRVSYDTEISVLVYIPKNTHTNQCSVIYRETHFSIFYDNQKHRHPRCLSPGDRSEILIFRMEDTSTCLKIEMKKVSGKEICVTIGKVTMRKS